MKKYYLLLFFIHSFVFAQVGIGTTTPDNSTMLDIFSTSKGFLVPRLSTFQRVSISSPATGLQVYDTTTNTLWYFNGTIWVQGTSFSSASKWTNDTSNSLVKLTNLSDGVTARIIDNSFVINDTGNVGIGTINPVSPLSISGTNASILIERFGLASHLVLRNAGGTKASPLATPAGQGTARLSGWSYDGTSYLPNGYIDILANGTQTATSRSGDMVFTTTDLNSTAATEKMRITPDGKVGIGTSNPNGNFEIETPNITKLNVNSTSATQFSRSEERV